MPTREPLPPEGEILRARAEGAVSADVAFDHLYALYAGPVMTWLRLRANPGAVDDLFQDVWRVFLGRWRHWQHRPEMDSPDARPVLSFLYRTCHFVLRQRRRTERVMEPLGEVPNPSLNPEVMARTVDFGRCLALAKELCSPEELDVLLAKLAGVRAREIARTLGVTEAVVDHRYRDAMVRLRRRLRLEGKGRSRGSRANK
jgi:DNA-directed RNA polymerase specialized sigma24 family protein